LKLLKHFKIAKKKIIIYNNISEKSEYLTSKTLELMLNYDNISIISCAGYPLVSDPGRLIIKEWIRRGFYVIPISGSSAFLNALVCSGFYCHNFAFLGFLPKSKVKQSKILSIYHNNFNFALVIYESPHRIFKTLSNINEFMGNRMIAVCKEITKIHEEFIRGSVKDVISHFHNSKEIIKGEYVIVVSIDLPEDQPFINRVLSVKKSKLVKNAVNKIKN